MATWFTHPVVPIALGIGLGSQLVPWRMLFAGIALSLLPDLDIFLRQFGVSWHSVYGHRGFTHSLGFAVMMGILMAWGFRQQRSTAFLFGFLVVASHALLDSLTWGGQGVAIYWPLSDARILMPDRPLPASPMGWRQFMRWGPTIVMTEIKVVWVPLLGAALAIAVWRQVLRSWVDTILRRLRNQST